MTGVKNHRRIPILAGILAIVSALTAVSGMAAERDVRGAKARTLRPGQMDSRQRYGSGGFLRRRYTMEDFNRWARQAAVKRVTSSQLDHETGLLAWPRVLLGREYVDLRRNLDRLFEDRASLGGAIDNEMYDDILDKIGQMTDRLTASVHRVRGSRGTRGFLQALNFLMSLAIEPDFPTSASVSFDADVNVNLANH